MRAKREDRNIGNGVQAYEVTKIGVLDETPNTPNGTDGLNSELEASSAVAKLLQNVGKSYEKKKNLLSEEFKTGMVTGSKQGDVANVRIYWK